MLLALVGGGNVGDFVGLPGVTIVIGVGSVVGAKVRKTYSPSPPKSSAYKRKTKHE